jgi:hypothetical protein
VAQSSALDRIKNVARTGFGVGRTVAGQAAKAATVGATKAAGAVSGYVASRRQSGAAPTPSVPAPTTPPPPRSKPEPKPTSEPKTTSEPKAKSEPTPADVAKLVAKKPRPAAPATKAVKKPAKKSVPGAKLPPRKPAE